MSEPTARSPRRADVERIVREVLAEMNSSARKTEHAPEDSSAGQLVLTAKVISLAELENRLDGVSRLVVPPGAVLTPAARDELRKRRVTICKQGQ